MMKRLIYSAFLALALSLPAGIAVAQSSDYVQPFTAPSTAPGGTLPQFESPTGLLPAEPESLPLAPVFTPVAIETPEAPVVVELFTSEGCSTCPPANEYLRELAQRKNVLPLSFHVDYWDYIGWKDRFASPVFTQRQRAYAAAHGKPLTYTPQMVIAGAIETLGTDKKAVEKALKAADHRKAMYSLILGKDADGGIHLSLPAAPLSVPASLWLVTYSYEDASDVTAGENRGRRVVTTNVVHTLRKVGIWDGTPGDQIITLTAEERAAKPDGCAIIANEAEFGPVVAAAGWDFKDLW